MSDDDLATERDRLRAHLAAGRALSGVPAGTVLRLGPDDWRYYGAPDGDLVLAVDRVGEHLGRDDGGWVRVEGVRIDAAGRPAGPVEVLARRAVLAAELARLDAERARRPPPPA